MNLKKKRIEKLKYFLKTASIFYAQINIEIKQNLINKGAITYIKSTEFDEKLLYLRSLSYIMRMYSNESCISDNIVLFNLKPKSKYDAMTAYIDQYLLIYEWYLMYKHKPSNILEYFDMICKYIFNSNVCLTFLPEFKDLIDQELVNHSIFWKDKIRGRFSITEARNIRSTASLILYLEVEFKTPKKLFQKFKNIYKDIYKLLNERKNLHYIKKVLKEIKNVELSITSGIIFL